jgi:large repetitive protein
VPQPASTWARQVYFDATGRARAEKDLAGRRSWLYWAADRDVVTASVDPAGRMSTQVVDHRGRTLQAYGPAPASCFGGYIPSATPPTASAPTSTTGSCANIPRTDTVYDAQIGLAYTAWNNAGNPAAPSAGPPVKHGFTHSSAEWSLVAMYWRGCICSSEKRRHQEQARNRI